ncbi:MAG: IS1595 family transposase [Proteobacteria bacterium]|nr:IS1595 family transposase [Pseudomonadota bacterium]
MHSDEYRPYNGLDNMGYTHKRCNHGAKQYSVNGSHVNTLEGFWSRLKSSINGTHIHISGKHLDKYAAEFEYRFNSRLSPENMLPELLGTFPLPLKK